MVGKSVDSYFSTIYAISSLVNFSVVGVLYVSVMIYVLKSSRVRKSSDSSHSVLMRLGAIIIANFLPSIIVITLSLVSISPNTLPASIEANISYFLFPLNAPLNPFFNTLSTARFLATANRIKAIILSWPAFYT